MFGAQCVHNSVLMHAAHDSVLYAYVWSSMHMFGAQSSLVGSRCSFEGVRCSLFVGRFTVFDDRFMCSVLGVRCSMFVQSCAKPSKSRNKSGISGLPTLNSELRSGMT